MSKKFSTLNLCFFLVLIYSVLAQRSLAADVETVGDLKVSGMIDNTGGEGIKFPDGNIQTSACTGCAGGILSISLGGTGATSASEALANLGGVNTAGDTMTGNLSVPSLFMSGNLTLPATTASTGIIKSGFNNLLHRYGPMNFFAGVNAGNTTMTGSRNTGVGESALGANGSGGWNAGVGSYALASNSTGTGNSAVGSHALYGNTTGGGNTAIGNGALYSNVSGNYNTAVGSNALWESTGYGNTAVGTGSLQKNTTGNYNTTTGRSALGSNLTGGSNAAYGDAALYGNTSGSFNTALGYQAGYTSTSANANTTGSNNTFIGYNSGPGTSTQLTNATAIGANAMVGASNSLVLGAPGVKVGIGTATPNETLDVVGKVRLNKKDILLADGTDVNHGLGWYGSGKAFATASPDGPVLYGYVGGALGTTAGGQKVVMKWHWSDGFDFYGYARFNTLSTGSTSACLDSFNTISTCSSDARMKKDVITLSENMDVLEALAKLRGVLFTWDRTNDKAANMSSGRDMGMIAQEVEEVFPEIIHTDKEGYKSMDYPKLVAFLVEVNKAQQSELTARKADIDRLNRTVEELADRLSALEGRR
jgi:hypothetical protein